MKAKKRLNKKKASVVIADTTVPDLPVPSAAAAVADGDKIKIRQELEPSQDTTSLNYRAIFLRIAPMLAFRIPDLILFLAGQSENNVLKSLGAILSFLLSTFAFALCLDKIPELNEVFKAGSVSFISFLGAVFALGATEIGSHIMSDKCVPLSQLTLPRVKFLGAFTELTLRLVLVSSTVILYPLAEELALRSWFYRETLFMRNQGKQGFAWKDFTEIPFSSFEVMETIQTCAILAIISHEPMTKAFVSRLVLLSFATFGGTFSHFVHSHWLYSAIDICLQIMCRNSSQNPS